MFEDWVAARERGFESRNALQEIVAREQARITRVPNRVFNVNTPLEAGF